MTPIEFLVSLHQPPASTPLNLPHVAAALEMLARRPNDGVRWRERWSYEVALAQPLGEPDDKHYGHLRSDRIRVKLDAIVNP